MANQVHISAQQKSEFRPSAVGKLETPTITLLGSLDGEQNASEHEITSQNPKPFLAIIYTGI
jgi:hypothetical protein